MRYGQLYQQEQKQVQNSLFGEGTIEISRPKKPEVEAWSTIDRLNKERELVGIYLSAHPLDEYRFILDNICNVKCEELKRDIDWEKFSKLSEICFGGTITEIREGISKKNKPFGIVRIEDFNGSGELALFHEDWLNWRGSMIPESNVLIKAVCQERFKGVYGLKVVSVSLLQTIKEEKIPKFTIMMDAASVSDEVVGELTKNLLEHPGKTEVNIQINDVMKNHHVVVRCRNSYILISNSLLSLIEENEGLDYMIN